MAVTSVISLIVRVDLARQMSPNSHQTTRNLPEASKTSKKKTPQMAHLKVGLESKHVQLRTKVF